MGNKGLRSRVIKTEDINWRELQFIQQNKFKELPEEVMLKLKASLVANNFVQPCYIWEDTDGVRYCLDGKHRSIALEQLVSEGVDVPYLLPATFIRCENKQDAAKLVLIYSSYYAKITQQGLFDFMKVYELEMSSFSEEVNLPEFSMPRFEQKFDVFGTSLEKEIDIGIDDAVIISEGEEIIINKGDIFQLGEHRLYCGSFEDSEAITLLMDGNKARIINTDPPYNMSANYIGNVDKKTHDNFAMGHGEMSDDEFIEFISKIMMVSYDNSIAGSIHYIFMDFRHSWHMAESARKVYGSPIPKQMCVWVKDMMALGSFYRAQHELCFIYKSGDAKHLSNLDLMDRVRSNVWRYPSAVSVANPDKNEIKNHPTPKPVNMIADCILDTTIYNDVVADWFLGSGTCLIACEKTGRRCVGTEIEPKYVQSIIKRYIKYCNNHDIKIIFRHLNGNLELKDFIYGKRQ